MDRPRFRPHTCAATITLCSLATALSLAGCAGSPMQEDVRHNAHRTVPEDAGYDAGRDLPAPPPGPSQRSTYNR